MFSRVARAALFFATMLVASTLARSTFAAVAPFCDDRGASALAPPPVLEAPDEAVRKARIEKCASSADDDGWFAALRPTHTRRTIASESVAHASLPGRVALPRSVVEVETAVREVVGYFRPGMRSRVERPPRG
jgi:hypothetical protein